MSENETLEQATQTLTGVLQRMGLQASVDGRLQDGSVLLDIVGDDVAIAIGGKGRTLDALQLVVGRAVNRGKENPTHVVVDGAGYRERRLETLKDLALKLRDRVLQTGEPVEIDDLTAAERRIVHGTLAEAGGVTSHSEGQDPYRVLVIELINDSQSTFSG